jgi:hypothetical protein
MEGAKKAEDKLNMVGVVVVGICGAVLVYVSIVLLEAFYMNDTAEVNTMADYGGQDTDVKTVKAGQAANITGFGKNTGEPTFRISIDRAMELVAAEAKADPANLVPSVGRSEKATIQPAFGRPQLLGAPAGAAAPAPAAPAGGAAGASAGSDASNAAAPRPTEGNVPGANVSGAPTGPAPASGAGNGAGTGAAPVVAPVPPAPSGAAGQGTGGNGK